MDTTTVRESKDLDTENKYRKAEHEEIYDGRKTAPFQLLVTAIFNVTGVFIIYYKK